MFHSLENGISSGGRWFAIRTGTLLQTADGRRHDAGSFCERKMVPDNQREVSANRRWSFLRRGNDLRTADGCRRESGSFCEWQISPDAVPEAKSDC